VQTLFRNQGSQKAPDFSSDKFLLMVMAGVMCFSRDDLAKFAADKTGRSLVPSSLAETEKSAGVKREGGEGKRYWLEFHQNNAKNLSLAKNTSALTARFYKFFQERVEILCPSPPPPPTPIVDETVVDGEGGEWSVVCLFQFMRHHMAGAAITALAGTKFLSQGKGESDVLGAFWDYDRATVRLLWPLPKWLDPEPWRSRERFHQMAVKWLREEFDPVAFSKGETDRDEEEDWHPVMGLRFMENYLRWGRDIGLSVETRAGYFIGFLLG